ncbi:uncharacterized protein BDV14DRAFT_205127 [Aspergillus stella-maris]|uniref:uncharacterized protein n=1 Tax=Aspergillus stella-maris TaxID=1810926 RepID=UPI003CCDD1B2
MTKDEDDQTTAEAQLRDMEEILTDVHCVCVPVLFEMGIADDRFKENHELRHEASRLRQRKREDIERIDQQRHLLRQARDQVSIMEERHQMELNKAYAKLNEAQGGRQRLKDDEIRYEMRRLEQYLASWVKSNFRDTAGSEPVLNLERLPQSSADYRASIQSSIGEEIFYTIFKPPWFGVPSGYTEEVVNELDGGVRETCSAVVYASWKAATGTAMEALTAEPRGQLIDNLIADAEDRWSNLSSTNAEPRTRTLKKLLGQCATFKDLLSRDPEIFGFFMSAPGAEFDERRMTSIGGNGKDGAQIELSLWPVIYKLIDDGQQKRVIESELVYMKAQSSDSVRVPGPNAVPTELLSEEREQVVEKVA